jgi:tetratricopeptide (TPR) repeat protein
MMRRLLLLAALTLLLVLSAPPTCAAKAKPKNKNTPAPTTAAAQPSFSTSSSPPPKSERDNDPVILQVRGLRNTAMKDNDRKAYDASIEKLREALTLMHNRVFGDGRAAVKKSEQSMDAALYAQLLTDYGGVLIRSKNYDEAIDVLEDAIEMIKRVFGESHPSMGLSLRSLAEAYLAKKEYKTAIKKYKSLRKHIEIGLGVAHEAYIEVHLKIAEAYKKLDKVPRAVKTLKKALDDQGDEVNGATQGIGEVYVELATLQLKTRELADAERAAEAARAIMRHREGEKSLPHAFALNALAGVKMAQNQVEAAYKLLQQAHAIALELFGKGHSMVTSSQQTLDQVKLRLDDERRKAAEGDDGHSEL